MIIVVSVVLNDNNNNNNNNNNNKTYIAPRLHQCYFHQLFLTV